MAKTYLTVSSRPHFCAWLDASFVPSTWELILVCCLCETLMNCHGLAEATGNNELQCCHNTSVKPSEVIDVGEDVFPAWTDLKPPSELSKVYSPKIVGSCSAATQTYFFYLKHVAQVKQRLFR